MYLHMLQIFMATVAELNVGTFVLSVCSWINLYHPSVCTCFLIRYGTVYFQCCNPVQSKLDPDDRPEVMSLRPG